MKDIKILAKVNFCTLKEINHDYLKTVYFGEGTKDKKVHFSHLRNALLLPIHQ